MARRAAPAPAFSSTRVRPLGAADGGPHDVADLDPALAPLAGLVDFGALRVPVPPGGVVDLEPPADGRMQAVHVSMPEGRLSVSALAAPKSGRLWPDLAKEIDASLRESGTRVRSYPGEWGRELHATTGAATSVFIGFDGPRWMVYGVATGPTRDAVTLHALLRRMLSGLVVVRGRAPYPVRTVLPLVVPAGRVEMTTRAIDGVGPRPHGRGPGSTGSPTRSPRRGLRPDSGPHGGGRGPFASDSGPGAATAAFSAVVRAARPGPEISEGATATALPAVSRPPVPPRRASVPDPSRPPLPTGPPPPAVPPRVSSPAAWRTGGAAPSPPHRPAAVPPRPARPSHGGAVPGPTGDELFAPSTALRPIVGSDGPGATTGQDGLTAPGRHARPEPPPAWRWPDNHDPRRSGSASGRGIRPGPGTEASIRATLRREGTEGHEINGVRSGRGRHADPERSAPHDVPPPSRRPAGAGRHHRPDL